MHDEMNRLFDRWGLNAPRAGLHGGYPLLNLWEDDNHVYVEAELPGFDLKDLDVMVTGDNQLSLKGERKQLELEGGKWHRQERGFGSFNRLVELPCPVESQNVDANFKNGVLTIKLPKRAELKPRRIEVKVN
jgi:HSP20 family protein